MYMYMYLYICKNSSWVIQYNDKCIYWIIHVHAMHTCTCTVEPPYKGHLGTRHFVIYNITEPIEVVSLWRFKMYCQDMKFYDWDH